MACQRCNSEHVISYYGKVSDLCVVSIGNYESDGYPPEVNDISGGDDIQFEACLTCGQIQGTFPKQVTYDDDTLVVEG